jgi:RNA polymerase sigma factor (sigma-70 family)
MPAADILEAPRRPGKRRVTNTVVNVTSDSKRVFISYGTADASHVAEWLHQGLARMGYRVWRDKNQLRDGEDWSERIERELTAADAVVALLSPHAVRSGGECRNEIGIAKDRGKKIVPVMVRRCEPPLRIYELQRVDLEGFDGLSEVKAQSQLDRIVEAIEHGVPEDPGVQQVRAALPRLDFQWMFSRHEGFVGREWLLDSFDRWFEADAEQALFLVGPAGIGKSAALCRWVQSRMDIGAVHFCRADRADLRDPVKMVASIASQLVTIQRDLSGYAERILAPALEAARRPGSADQAQELFDRLVCDPIREMAGGRKWVLVVDALDEGGPAIAQLLSDYARENRLPPRLRLLVSSRPEQHLLGLFPNKRVIEAKGAENLDDLRTFAKERARQVAIARRWGPERADRIADRVVENAGGLFSFAVSAMDSLENGSMSPAQLESISAGQEALYLSIFSKFFPDQEGFDAIAGMLEIIVASSSPVSDAQIAAILDLPQRSVSRELGKLGSLLRVVDGVRVPFHKSLIDWLRAGAAGHHPFGIEPGDGLRLMRQWYERTRDPATAFIVADALIEVGQSRQAVEILRDAAKQGALVRSSHFLGTTVSLALKLAAAEQLAEPSRLGAERAIQVLKSILEKPELRSVDIDVDSRQLASSLSSESCSYDTDLLRFLLEVHSALLSLYVQLGSWELASASAKIATTLHCDFGLPMRPEVDRLCKRCEIELARAEGRPAPWKPRGGAIVDDLSTPLERVLHARGLSVLDPQLSLAELLTEEFVITAFERSQPADFWTFDSDGDVLAESRHSRGVVQESPTQVTHAVDPQYLAAVVRISREIAQQAVGCSRVEVVCAPSIGAIVGGVILAKVIGRIRAEPSFRPTVLGFGDDVSCVDEAGQSAVLRILIGRHSLQHIPIPGVSEFTVCDGTRALRTVDGRDLGAGTEGEGGPALVAACVALSMTANRFAAKATHLIPDIAVLAVLGSLDGVHGWKYVRYFYNVVLESFSAGGFAGGDPPDETAVRDAVAEFHHLMDRFSRLQDLVRSGDGDALADLLCKLDLADHASFDSWTASSVGSLALALLFGDVPSDDLSPPVRSPSRQAERRSFGLIEALDDASEGQRIAVAVGEVSAESDALVFKMRNFGPDRLICHAACRRVRDLRLALESSLGLVVDFLPTSQGERCDFLVMRPDRGLVADKLMQFVSEPSGGGDSPLDMVAVDLNADHLVYDTSVSLAEIHPDRGLGDACALLMPFSRQFPHPTLLISAVSIAGMDLCLDSDVWKKWGTIELCGSGLSSRVLCVAGSPEWRQLEQLIGPESGQAQVSLYDLLLVPLPLQVSSSPAAFEVLAIRVHGSHMTLAEQREDKIRTQREQVLRSRINDVLRTLTYREREILKLRYGIGDGYVYTPDEVGRIFKISADEVRQVEDSAILKLQHPVRVKRLQEFLDSEEGDGGAPGPDAGS